MVEMKDSGTVWIGMIPDTWKLSKISSIYELRTQKVSDKDYPPLSVTMNGIVPQLDSAAKTNAHDDRKLVKKGDFAINSRSDRRGSCGVSEYDGSVSLINIVMKPRDEMNPDYYNWLFHTVQFADEFYKWGHGIVDDLWTTNWQDMKHIDIPIPTLEEQKIIADYLNKTIPEIDALHRDIEKQIETLEEYKKSIITEAVTKGLDPYVEMKDSKIDLIGLIPKTWKTVKTKYVSSISIGLVTTMTANYVDNPDEGVPLIRNGDIRTNKIKPNGMVYLSKKFAERNSNRKLQEKDIVTVHTGYVGTSAVIKDEFIGSVGFATIQSRPNLDMVNERYLCWFYNSNSFIEQCIIHNTGDGRQNLNLYDFVDLWIVLPDLNEQEIIADYLDLKCEEIDIVVQEVKKQLEILEEYKKSLIYEYVTGKKEVK